MSSYAFKYLFRMNSGQFSIDWQDILFLWSWYISGFFHRALFKSQLVFVPHFCSDGAFF